MLYMKGVGNLALVKSPTLFFKGYAKKEERMKKILRRIFTYLMRNDALSLLFSRWRTFLDSEIDVIPLLFR